MSLRDVLGVPSTQVPIGLTTFLSHIFPLAVSYVAMAMLAVAPKTRVFRVALWPVVTSLTLRAAFVDWSCGKDGLRFFNGEFIVCIVQYRNSEGNSHTVSALHNVYSLLFAFLDVGQGTARATPSSCE